MEIFDPVRSYNETPKAKSGLEDEKKASLAKKYLRICQKKCFDFNVGTLQQKEQTCYLNCS